MRNEEKMFYDDKIILLYSICLKQLFWQATHKKKINAV